jgi:hypothetical protein
VTAAPRLQQSALGDDLGVVLHAPFAHAAILFHCVGSQEWASLVASAINPETEFGYCRFNVRDEGFGVGSLAVVFLNVS